MGLIYYSWIRHKTTWQRFCKFFFLSSTCAIKYSGARQFSLILVFPLTAAAHLLHKLPPSSTALKNKQNSLASHHSSTGCSHLRSPQPGCWLLPLAPMFAGMEKTSVLKDRDFSRRDKLPGVLPKWNVASLAGEESEINGFYAHLQFLPRFGYCQVQLSPCPAEWWRYSWCCQRLGSGLDDAPRSVLCKPGHRCIELVPDGLSDAAQCSITRPSWSYKPEM